MATVSKEFLINSLYLHPSSDKEIGFNSAIILLLKELVRPTLSNEEEIFRKSVYTPSHFDLIDSYDRKQIIDFAISSQKLSAVKLYKDKTGVGLKEAKETMDLFFDRIQKLKTSNSSI